VRGSVPALLGGFGVYFWCRVGGRMVLAMCGKGPSGGSVLMAVEVEADGGVCAVWGVVRRV